MQVGPARGGRPPAHLLAAGALTLGLVGDAVMYAVLPAAAAAYGLGAVGVAAALSVNRFARLALNPIAAAWLARSGLRRGGVVGAVLALVSTVGYAIAPGLAALLTARVAWGASFATLRLTVQGYATSQRRSAARRLGDAAALQELAPAVLLVVGTAALAPLGVRGLFWALAGLTALALPLALALPPSRPEQSSSTAAGAPSGRAAGRGTATDPLESRAAVANTVAPNPASAGGTHGPTPAQAHPWGPGSLLAASAFGVDGVLTAGIVLALMAVGWPPLVAAQAGGWLLAARKVGQVLSAPLAGRAGERFGVVRVVRLAGAATTLGLIAMAAAPFSAAALLAGTVVAMLAGSVVATLVPAVVGGDHATTRLRQLGWLANARDLGAAVGAAVGPLLLVGAEHAGMVSWAFGVPAVLVALACVIWRPASA